MLTRLDESLFYLIVFGPGFGESVCLRVPPSQWVVVDGCARRGRSYPQHLVSLYPESTMAAVALTHPHLDHARGLLELVEDRVPVRMGCLPPLDAVNVTTDLDNPELDMAEGETEHLISRMHSEWLFRPECRWELLAGRELTVGEAQILVLSPDGSCRDRYLEERRTGHPRANEISSAMRVSWRGLTLVLGADLERLPADSGWEGVRAKWPSLRNHQALKIPHHASQTAVCERLGARATDTEGTGERFWVATPFSRGRQLPRFDDGEGVARLLAWESRLHLTGLPRQVFTAEEWPISRTRRELEEALRDPDVPGVPPGAYGFPDHYIVAGFDERANLVDLRHGPGTFVVTQ